MPRVPNRYPRRSTKGDSSRLSLTSARKAKKLTIHLRRTTNNTTGQKCSPDKAQIDKKSEYLQSFHFLLFVLLTLLYSSFLGNDESISDMLAVINRHEEENPPSDDSALAVNALPHSIRHQFLIDAVTQDFLTALFNTPNKKWTALLQPTPHVVGARRKMAPKLFVLLGGEKTPEKVQIANKALIDWMAVMRKKQTRSVKIPWYQPSTQNQRLRTLLGSTTKQYGWRYDIADFSFKGGLKGFLDRLYDRRYKEFGKVYIFFYIILIILFYSNFLFFMVI